jgi:hypothetical protein
VGNGVAIEHSNDLVALPNFQFYLACSKQLLQIFASVGLSFITSAAAIVYMLLD